MLGPQSTPYNENLADHKQLAPPFLVGYAHEDIKQPTTTSTYAQPLPGPGSDR